VVKTAGEVDLDDVLGMATESLDALADRPHPGVGPVC
jgi:hypothetical protein